MKFEIGKQYAMESYDSGDSYMTLVVPYAIEDNEYINCLIWNEWKSGDWIKTFRKTEPSFDTSYPIDDFYREWRPEQKDMIETLFGEIKEDF